MNLQERTELVKLLSNISTSMDLGLTDEELVQFIINRMRRRLRYLVGFAVNFDEEDGSRTVLENSWSFDNSINEPTEIEKVIQESLKNLASWGFGDIVMEKQAITFPISESNELVQKYPEYKGLNVLCVPILLRVKLKGVLVFISSREVELKDESQGLLDLIGKQIGSLAYKREVAILTQVSSRNAEFFNLLQVISRAANDLLAVEDLAKIAIDEICRMMGWPLGGLFMKESKDGKDFIKASNTWYCEDDSKYGGFIKKTKELEFHKGVGMAGRVMENKKPLWVMNVQKDNNFPQSNFMQSLPVKGAFSFPIVVVDEVTGVLQFYSDKQKSPDEFVLKIVYHIGEQLGLLMERLQIEKLKKAKEVAEKSAEFKTTFLATMSHEIRTPMNGIIGMIDLLYKDTKLTEKQEDYLGTISKSSEALLTIINDILDLSKIEAGKMPIDPQPMEPRSLVKRVVDLFEGKALEKELDVKYEIADDVPKYLVADEHRIGQILSNILSNGIKNTQRGGVTIKLTMDHIKSNEAMMRFEVIDTGRGILASEKEKLFQKYSQLSDDGVRSHDGTKSGTGLGLTISKNLSELMGGEIGVESEFRKGSNFWFTICAKTLDEKGANKFEEKKAEKPGGGNKFNMNVLVVEDKPVNQKVVELMLRGLGCDVDIANNGEEGIFAVKDHPGKYDIILMDIQMPIMDGVIATTELKRNFPNLPPIVALSANGMEGDREYYLSKGLDDYMAKPVRMDALVGKLSEVKSGKVYSKPLEEA